MFNWSKLYYFHFITGCGSLCNYVNISNYVCIDVTTMCYETLKTDKIKFKKY